jgi:hypothetical protein
MSQLCSKNYLRRKKFGPEFCSAGPSRDWFGDRTPFRSNLFRMHIYPVISFIFSSPSHLYFSSTTSQHVSNYNKSLGSIRPAASAIYRHDSAANDPEQHNHVEHFNHFDHWKIDNHLHWDKWCDFSHSNCFSLRTTSKLTARSELGLEGKQHLNLRCFCRQFGRNTRSGFLVSPPRICPPHVDRTSHVHHFPPMPSMRNNHH